MQKKIKTNMSFTQQSTKKKSFDLGNRQQFLIGLDITYIHRIDVFFCKYHVALLTVTFNLRNFNYLKSLSIA